jgi:hypothetical protein
MTIYLGECRNVAGPSLWHVNWALYTAKRAAYRLWVALAFELSYWQVCCSLGSAAAPLLFAREGPI